MLTSGIWSEQKGIQNNIQCSAGWKVSVQHYDNNVADPISSDRRGTLFPAPVCVYAKHCITKETTNGGPTTSDLSWSLFLGRHWRGLVESQSPAAIS